MTWWGGSHSDTSMILHMHRLDETKTWLMLLEINLETLLKKKKITWMDWNLRPASVCGKRSVDGFGWAWNGTKCGKVGSIKCEALPNRILWINVWIFVHYNPSIVDRATFLTNKGSRNWDISANKVYLIIFQGCANRFYIISHLVNQSKCLCTSAGMQISADIFLWHGC